MKTIEPSQSSGGEAININELKYWFTIHTSLDVVEEKTKRLENKDLYLGLLYLIEDYRM